MRVLHLTTFLQGHATRARSLYTEKFSTTVMAQHYLNLYQRLPHAPLRTRPKKRVA